MKRRAFTLIELLVVIAIIAILAAILFPVFAQAKKSAKAAASLAHIKQVTMAEMMYAVDRDDKFVPDYTWGGPTAILGWNWSDPNTTYAPWSWLVLPYIKTAGLLQDPQTAPEPRSWGSNAITYCNYTQFGYNYSNLSPSYSSNPQGGWFRSTLSQSGVVKPAETVMMAAKNSFAKGNGEWWWWGYGSGLIGQCNVDGPDCNIIPGWCWGNWGTTTGNCCAYPLTLRQRIEGSNTGFVSLRKANQAIVSFVDGHCQSMDDMAIAAGTNWTPNVADTALVTPDVSKYIWDVN